MNKRLYFEKLNLRVLYIVGLPRSGKTTLMQILGSCKDVFTIEEPPDLIYHAFSAVNARRSVQEEFCDPLFGFRLCIQQYACELLLGRRFNIRVGDRTNIFDVKSDEERNVYFGLDGRRSAVEYSCQNMVTLVISLNDCEHLLNFLHTSLENVSIIRTKRDFESIRNLCIGKGWFTSMKISDRADMLPLGRVRMFDGDEVLIPYNIEDGEVAEFVQLEEDARVSMFLEKQELALDSYSNYDLVLSVPEYVKRIQYETDLLTTDFGLVPGDRTASYIKKVLRELNI